jgi:molybdopterin synthase sulfur carrier subunit
MKVRVRYFASLREQLGAEEAVELPEGATVGALRAEVLSDGAEVAFFPPVTGG